MLYVERKRRRLYVYPAAEYLQGNLSESPRGIELPSLLSDLLEEASDESGELAMIFTGRRKFGVQQHDQIGGGRASAYGRSLPR